MKDESKKEKILENEENEFSSTRRTFVKRSMSSVPIVMTLRSGAAFAATSATCMVKLTNGNIGANPDVLLGENDDNFNSDQWVRSSTARQSYLIKPSGRGDTSPAFWIFEINPDSNIFISDDSRTDKSNVQYELIVPNTQTPAASSSDNTDPSSQVSDSSGSGAESDQNSGLDGSASTSQASEAPYFQVLNTPTIKYTIESGPILKFVTIIADKNGQVMGLGLDNTSGDGTANAFDSCWSSLGLGTPSI